MCAQRYDANHRRRPHYLQRASFPQMVSDFEMLLRRSVPVPYNNTLLWYVMKVARVTSQLFRPKSRRVTVVHSYNELEIFYSKRKIDDPNHPGSF